eukprot:2957526-Prymnesium_polylepis.1
MHKAQDEFKLQYPFKPFGIFIFGIEVQDIFLRPVGQCRPVQRCTDTARVHLRCQFGLGSNTGSASLG